jgi:hypothetical protein
MPVESRTVGLSAVFFPGIRGFHPAGRMSRVNGQRRQNGGQGQPHSPHARHPILIRLPLCPWVNADAPWDWPTSVLPGPSAMVRIADAQRLRSATHTVAIRGYVATR